MVVTPRIKHVFQLSFYTDGDLFSAEVPDAYSEIKAMPTAQSVPENRLTVAQIQVLMRLASQMSIQVKPVQQDREFALELSGEGFSGIDPVTLSITTAYARLLAEVCSGLAPWVQFSPDEPCEVTLFGLSEDVLKTTIQKYQYRLAMRLSEKHRDERRAKRRFFSSNETPPPATESTVSEASVG